MHWSALGFAAWSLLSLKLITVEHEENSLTQIIKDTMGFFVCMCVFGASVGESNSVSKHTHTHAMSTYDWQRSSIRGLPRAHAHQEKLSQKAISHPWWHAYFRLPFLHSTSPHFSSLTPSSSMFSSLIFPPSLSVWDMTCYLTIPQPWTHLKTRSPPPALKYPLKYN